MIYTMKEKRLSAFNKRILNANIFIALFDAVLFV